MNLPLRRTRHEIIMYRPNHLAAHAQHIRMGEHVERHRDRALKRVLHRHERCIRRPRLDRMKALADVGEADRLRRALPPAL